VFATAIVAVGLFVVRSQSGELNMRWLAMLAMGLLAAIPARAQESEFVFPLIQGYGGIAVQPEAAEPPQHGAKIVFDITADSRQVR